MSEDLERFMSEVRAQLAAADAWGPASPPAFDQLAPALRALMAADSKLGTLSSHPAAAELRTQVTKAVTRLIGVMPQPGGKASPPTARNSPAKTTAPPPPAAVPAPAPAAQVAATESAPATLDIDLGFEHATLLAPASEPPQALQKELSLGFEQATLIAPPEQTAPEAKAEKTHRTKKGKSHRKHSKDAASDSGTAGAEEGLGVEHAEIAARDIRLDKLLGEGAFGRVSRASVKGQMVAAKVLKQDLRDHQVRLFAREVKMMRKVNHPNVVLFLGACTEPGHLTIVTELMSGDLESLIHGPRLSEYSLTQKLHMALDAAMGMNWLHDFCQIAHRDLKPANLLLDENSRVKVSDFGFSEVIMEGHTIRDIDRVKGTALYAAPEVLSGGQLGLSVDVYSFGLILWELITGKYAFEQYRQLEPFVVAVVTRNERPDLSGLPLRVAQLIARCWDRAPETRPPFSEVARALKELIVEASVDGEGMAFWKANFLDKELLERVPWDRFKVALTRALDLPALPDCECVPRAQQVSFLQPLSELPSGFELKQAPQPDWMGLAGLLCETERKELPVTMEKVMWFQHWFGGFSRESVLAAYNLTSHSWFHGCIDNNVAATRLRLRSDGMFLVRTSTRVLEAPFTLSAMLNKQITHVRILRKIQGGQTLFELDVDYSQGKLGCSPTLEGLVERMVQLSMVGKACPRIPIPY